MSSGDRLLARVRRLAVRVLVLPPSTAALELARAITQLDMYLAGGGVLPFRWRCGQVTHRPSIDDVASQLVPIVQTCAALEGDREGMVGRVLLGLVTALSEQDDGYLSGLDRAANTYG